jgi:diacylglycerol kinase (ATP)
MSDDHKTLRTDGPLKQLSESCISVPRPLQPGKTLGLGLISNPLSGGNRKGLHIIREELAGRPQVFHCEATTPPEVGSALAEFARRNVDVVAINGGDGTIHAVLTELFRQPSPGPLPLLALLRSGTASMIARDVGLSGSRRGALSRLLTWISTGSGSAAVVQRPVLKVEGASDQKPFYGMFLGAAGICQGIRFCLDRVHSKGVSGQLAAGLTLGRFLLAAVRGDKSLLSPARATVRLDSEPPDEREFLLMLISTLERLFLGIRPYWTDETGPLYYTALAARPQHLLRALPALLRGQKGRFCAPEHGYFSRKVREARLTLTGGFTLDGELYALDNQTTNLTITEGGKVSFLKL